MRAFALLAPLALGALAAGAGLAGVASTPALAEARTTASASRLHIVGPGGAPALPAPLPAPRPDTGALPPRAAPPRPPERVVRVVSLRPAPGSSNVTTGTRIFVTLSAPPPKGAPMPVLSPPVAGDWSVQGRALTFTPASGYRPWSTEHVSLPKGLVGPPGKSYSFGVGGIPLLRVQEALAELHYLPLRFGPSATASALGEEATAPAEVRTTAEPGVFSWRYPDVPASLAALWAPGQMTPLTEGAIMAFEDHAGLPIDGLPSERLWEALAASLAQRRQDTSAYNYLIVSESLPERLVVWQDGKDVFTTPVNTGVAGAATPIGTWPVYERFVTTTMAGTDPDGLSYDVSGVPWVAYFYEGDAVHGYWRSYFGYPQSNGCVELPISNAAVVWTMDPIGTLVSVVP